MAHRTVHMEKKLLPGFNCDFTTVDRIVLPSFARKVLSCCPNVKRVICSQGSILDLASTMKRRCSKIEAVLECRPHQLDLRQIRRKWPILIIVLGSSHLDAEILESTPNLREFNLEIFTTANLQVIIRSASTSVNYICTTGKNRLPHPEKAMLRLRFRTAVHIAFDSVTAFVKSIITYLFHVYTLWL